MTLRHAPAAPMRPLPLSLPGLVGRLWRRARRAAEISRRRWALLGLPDYMLKDIGLSRSEIDYVVMQSVDRAESLDRRDRP